MYQHGATTGTAPLFSAPLERLMDIATGMTGAGTGEKAVYGKEVLSLPFQLVSQTVTEHPEALFAVYLAISHTHSIPVVGYPMGFLVNEVLALVGNMLIEGLNFP